MRRSSQAPPTSFTTKSAATLEERFRSAPWIEIWVPCLCPRKHEFGAWIHPGHAYEDVSTAPIRRQSAKLSERRKGSIQEQTGTPPRVSPGCFSFHPLTVMSPS